MGREGQVGGQVVSRAGKAVTCDLLVTPLGRATRVALHRALVDLLWATGMQCSAAGRRPWADAVLLQRPTAALPPQPQPRPYPGPPPSTHTN